MSTYVRLGLASGLAVIAIAVVTYFVFSTPSPAPASKPSPTLPIAGNQPPSEMVNNGGVTFTSTTSPMTSTQVNDLLKNPATVADPVNSGYYYIGYHTRMNSSDTTATDSPPYVIEYIAATHYFNVELLQEPIGQARAMAEQYLMAQLGLSQDQMCRLSYMVSVPYVVNSFFSGRNLGFSFCPGALALPQ